MAQLGQALRDVRTHATADDSGQPAPEAGSHAEAEVRVDGAVIVCASPPLCAAGEHAQDTIGAGARVAIEQLAEACADLAVIDITALGWDADQIEPLLIELDGQARGFGLRLIVVGDPTVQARMGDHGTLGGLTFAPSVALALSEA